LATRYQSGKNGSGDKVGFNKQVCQKTDGATEQQYANDAVDIEALHIISLPFKIKISSDDEKLIPTQSREARKAKRQKN
jgi:hypothetical protein